MNVSAKKRAANRRNGLRSRGPRTPAGKQASSRNARRHGLFGRDLLLPCERREHFDTLARRLHAELAPATELEAIIVDRIVGLAWRLRRAARIEAEELTWGYYRGLEEEAEEEAQEHFDFIDGEVLDQKAYDSAMEQAGEFERRRTLATPIGRAFSRAVGSAVALDLIHRYETSFERSLFRNLRELERLQGMRTGNQG